MGRSLFLVGLPAAAGVVTAGLAFLGDLAPVTGVVTVVFVDFSQGSITYPPPDHPHLCPFHL